MSARQKFLDVLAGLSHELRVQIVDEILNDHAHELAGKQREAICKTDDPVYYESAAGWLPNLIDPEKKK